MATLDRAESNSKAEHAGQQFVRVSRNFGNYPIARPAETRLQWKPQPGCWICAPPGADFWIQLPRPRRVPLRLPTANDMWVLFALLREADVQKTTALVFRNRADFITNTVRWKRTKRRYDALLDALDYWSAATIVFERWHATGGIGGERQLPPPIRTWGLRQQTFRVDLHADWLKLHEHGFFTRVPLPLPQSVHVMNLAIYMLTVRGKRGDDGWTRTRAHSTRVLTSKLGIHHRNRSTVLERVLDEVDDWLVGLGGEAKHKVTDAGIVFAYQRPRLIQKKRRPAKDKAPAKGKRRPITTATLPDPGSHALHTRSMGVPARTRRQSGYYGPGG